VRHKENFWLPFKKAIGQVSDFQIAALSKAHEKKTSESGRKNSAPANYESLSLQAAPWVEKELKNVPELFAP
jgi:hypothetical protein